MRNVYLDYSATTPVKDEVLQEMIPYFSEKFGNPSSLYDKGLEAKAAVTHAREQVASLIGAQPREVFFTAGGTESDNWVVFGVADKLKDKGNHIITTKVEHHAMLHSCQFLEKHGYDVTYLDIDKDGRIRPEELEAAITEKTILISIMMVNNEIGTVQPIKELAAIAKKHGVLFHTDAVQALGNVPIDVKNLGIDLMSMSSHKIYGPKGSGALYIRRGVRLSNYLHGGAQEMGRRAGTENIPGIVGLKKATEIALDTMQELIEKESQLRDYLMSRVLKEVPYSRVNGSRTNRLPNNVNFCFQFIEGESLLIMLDMKGICASSGSACTSGSLDPSHVLLAIGLPHEIAHGSLRLTLGKETTKEDIDTTIEAIKEIVAKLRDMSPLYEDFKKKSQAHQE